MSDMHDTDRAILEAQYAALQELERRQREMPLFYADPHARQLEACRALMEQEVRGVLVTGGNRFGKTWWLRYIHWAHKLGYWPHLLPEEHRYLTEEGYYPPRDDIPPEYWTRRPDGLPTAIPAKILVVSGLSLDRGIGAVYWPDFESYIPASYRKKMRVRRGTLSVPIHVTDPYGSVTRFGSIEQGSMAFEGDNYTLVLFDEPPSRSVFTSCWRGLIDQFGRFAMGFTPLGAHAPWIHQEFIMGDRRDIRHVSGTQAENPHLTREALEDFEKGVEFSQEELEARKYGRFGFLTHRAFPTFDPAVHVIEPLVPPPNVPIRCACDPANRRPFFFLWAFYDRPRDAWVVFDEWPREPFVKMRSSPYGIDDYVGMINTTEASRKVVDRYIDPKFGPAEYTVQGQKLTSTVENFAKRGLFFSTNIEGATRIETGIMKIRDRLRVELDPRTMEVLVPPKLFVTRNCRNLIQALENYSFVPPNARDDTVLDEKLLEAFKDPIDTLRYTLLPAPPIDPGMRLWQRGNALRTENSFSLDDL